MSLLAPPKVALFGFFIFIFAWLFPVAAYESLFFERNYLNFDLTSLVFFALCSGSFILGYHLLNVSGFLPRRGSSFGLPSQPSNASFLVLVGPLALGAILTFSGAYESVVRNPIILLLLMQNEGDELKRLLQDSEVVSLSSVASMGIVWWALWRRKQMFLSSTHSILFACAIVAALAACISSALIKLGRGELIPLIVGTGVVISYTTSRKSARAELSRFALVSCAAAGVFLLFSILRGVEAGDTGVLARDFFGYTVASYNRFAALLSGDLTYPYSGRGIYLASFLGFNNKLNSVVPFGAWLQWPDFKTLWDSEFAATWSAGLNGYLIWSGAFGYAYADLGWAAAVYFAIIGGLYAVIWRLFQNSNAIGVVLYPWCFFCVFFWFGTNYLLDTKFIVLLLTATALLLYEKGLSIFFTRRRM